MAKDSLPPMPEPLPSNATAVQVTCPPTRAVQGSQCADLIGHVGGLLGTARQLLSHRRLAQRCQVALWCTVGRWRAHNYSVHRLLALLARRATGHAISATTQHCKSNEARPHTSALFFSARRAQAAALNS